MPRINGILTMFSVISPSTSTSTTKWKPSSYESQQKLKDDTVYFRELDDITIIKYLQSNPIPMPKDDDKVISMLFNEKFYDNKRKRNFQ